jgi:hypothetical protein
MLRQEFHKRAQIWQKEVLQPLDKEEGLEQIAREEGARRESRALA